jgi:hypothetical protein
VFGCVYMYVAVVSRIFVVSVVLESGKTKLFKTSGLYSSFLIF